MCCKYKNIVHRHILYVAKKYTICCKDKMYMLQRQNVYTAKTKLIFYKDKFICYKGKIICYRDKLICYKDNIIRSKDNIYML